MRYINGNTITRSSSGAQVSGLIPIPFIVEALGATVGAFVTGHIITINGFNFHPDSTVEISAGGVAISQTTFVNPSQLVIEITTDDDFGLHNIIVRNGNLDSGDTGNGLLNITNNPFIDLRTTTIGDLGLIITSGVTINQDSQRGLVAMGSGGTWNRGVLFSNSQWNRADNVNFSFVFTTTGNGFSMFGIGASSLDMNNLGNQSFFRGETKMFFSNGSTTTFFGGGAQTNWTQGIGTTTVFTPGLFYKVTFMNSGASGSQMEIHRVNENDFELNISLLAQWISDNPATAPVLVPFWAAPSNPNFFISGIKVF